MLSRVHVGLVALGLAMIVWGAGCPVPAPKPDSIPATVATCKDVCLRARDLGCAISKPTANGKHCVEVCENIQGSGVITWNLVCRIAATTCETADACEGI
jgi:hypothetical protein